MTQSNPPALPQPPPHLVIGFNWNIDRHAVQNLLLVAHNAVNQGTRKITICITSGGGAADQGFYAHELLVALSTRVELITHNVGVVHSAAVPIFLAGEKRYASPNTSFLLHETTHNPVGSLTADHLTFGAESVKADDQRAAGIVAARTGKDLKTVTRWFLGQKLRDTTFARENNIITEEACAFAHSADSRFYQIVVLQPA